MSTCDVQYWSGVAAACVVLGIVLLGAWATWRDQKRVIAQDAERISALLTRVRLLEAELGR